MNIKNYNRPWEAQSLDVEDNPSEVKLPKNLGNLVSRIAIETSNELRKHKSHAIKVIH